MNKKIKVSKKMFLGLEEGLRISTKEELLKDHMSDSEWISEEFSIFNTLSILEMAEILINGYELEETPEEKLLNEFNNAIQIANRKIPGTFDDGYWTGFKDGIYETLEIKKEKIKGINE